MAFVHDFHSRGKLPKAVIASFLALIPKSDNPKEVDDYGPTCVIGCLYHLLSKLLAGKLKKVGDMQANFI